MLATGLLRGIGFLEILIALVVLLMFLGVPVFLALLIVFATGRRKAAAPDKSLESEGQGEAEDRPEREENEPGRT